MENIFEELKRYVSWDPADEAALRALHPIARPEFERISIEFYDRVLAHPEARKALEGGESQVGRLRHTLVEWMGLLLTGPWDEAYYQQRARIGRVHVRINLPQHYMFGAMNVIRQKLNLVIDRAYAGRPAELTRARLAVGKLLDLELAIMLHTYREDLLSQQARVERLSTFGQLVGSIGHELRNPLGVMESSLFILKGRVGTDERVKKHIDRIGEQLVVANKIITNLLDMIRERPLAVESIHLDRVVAEALATLHPPPGVALTAEGLAGLPPVPGDATQLRQVILNLVENALHAAGEQGWVQVSGAAGPAGVALAVEDSGPGVAPEARARLFEPLVTTKKRGIGLGLALVKRIAERHGGSISYEPRGAGARFVLRLPAAPPAS